MALKDVLMDFVGGLISKKDDEVPRSEVIDTTNINEIPKEMLEELSNGKGDDE